MKILFVSPKFEVTFWSWVHLLNFIGKKAAFPPLGLLTIAAMLPKNWQKKLVDVNVERLTNSDIDWADHVFISAMATQKESTLRIIERCKRRGKIVVLGGPILLSGLKQFCKVDHFFIGEAEDTLPQFLRDIDRKQLRRVYRQPRGLFPGVNETPIPLWSLVRHSRYASAIVQSSRGCPFLCSFCNVCKINGRVPRQKTPEHFCQELDAIYSRGFRGSVFIADDNFAGSMRISRQVLLAMIGWQKTHGYPFIFSVEAPVTIADDPSYLDLMVLAGIRSVFLGLETSIKKSLVECGKTQNAKRDLRACVEVIQRSGMSVMSGFICGFDNDPQDTFASTMIDFIQESGVVMAMVGVLQAWPDTGLYKKLKRQKRLKGPPSGNNTDCTPNFQPMMPVEKLVEGYRHILQTIYSPKGYYRRACVLFSRLCALPENKKKIGHTELRAFLRSIWDIGCSKNWQVSYYYWKTLLTVAFTNPKVFAEAVTTQIFGVHFREIARVIALQ